ncbi:MAG: hypothetical protein FWD57_14160 [Polyangiaceae bacterium]|nr:hypothetical protein [Polyangiaceae bacterium]
MSSRGQLDGIDPLVGERNASPFWRSIPHLSQFVWGGFTKLSLLPLLCVAVTATLVAIGWWELVDLNQPFDGVLAFLWLSMALLVSWRVELRRDVVLVFTAVWGGFLIEWWGTTTQLWTYFTAERPPLWIIPAWPVAALSTERLSYMLDRAFPVTKIRYWWVLYLAVPAFIVWMCGFMSPSWNIMSSSVVLGIMIGVAISTKTPRRDMVLFIMGTVLGYGLEYWGTTRHCWTYHTRETPPLVTAFAHGFASIAFFRATQFFHRVTDMVIAVWRKSSIAERGADETIPA